MKSCERFIASSLGFSLHMSISSKKIEGHSLTLTVGRAHPLHAHFHKTWPVLYPSFACDAHNRILPCLIALCQAWQQADPMWNIVDAGPLKKGQETGVTQDVPPASHPLSLHKHLLFTHGRLLAEWTWGKALIPQAHGVCHGCLSRFSNKSSA